jgi:hypothetical protein
LPRLIFSPAHCLHPPAPGDPRPRWEAPVIVRFSSGKLLLIVDIFERADLHIIWSGISADRREVTHAGAGGCRFQSGLGAGRYSLALNVCISRLATITQVQPPSTSAMLDNVSVHSLESPRFQSRKITILNPQHTYYQIEFKLGYGDSSTAWLARDVRKQVLARLASGGRQ